MWAAVLNFSGILLISITFTDAVKVKVVPNGSKTTYKDGVSHQISKYILVPEDNDYNETKLASKVAEIKDENTIYKFVHNSFTDDHGNHEHGGHENHEHGGHENHEHGGHENHEHGGYGDVHYSGLHSYFKNGGVKFITEGNDNIPGFNTYDITVPEKTVVRHISYQTKPEKSVNYSYEDASVTTGDSKLYEHVKSTNVPFETVHSVHHRYESGGSGSKGIFDTSRDSVNMVKNIAGDGIIENNVNINSANIHNSDGGGENIASNLNYDILRNMGHYESDRNMDILSDARIKQSKEFQIDGKSYIDTNTNNLDDDKTKTTEHIFDESKTTIEENNKNTIDDRRLDNSIDNIINLTTDEELLTEPKLSARTIQNTDAYRSNENDHQDTKSGDMISNLTPLDALRSSPLDHTPDIFYSISDKTFESDEINMNQEFYREPISNEYYDDVINAELNAPEFEKDTEISETINDNVSSYKHHQVIPIDNNNYGFDAYETDLFEDTTNDMDKTGHDGTDMVPINSVHYSIINRYPEIINQPNNQYNENLFTDGNVLKYTLSQEYLNPLNRQNSKGFVIINGQKYAIDGNVIKYVLSNKQPNLIDEYNNYDFVIINGEKYSTDDNVLKYILSSKQSNFVNERIGNDFVVINGEIYEIDDDILQYINSHKYINDLNIQYIKMNDEPNANKINQAYILNKQNINDDYMTVDDNERQIDDIAFKKYQHVYEKPRFGKNHKGYHIRNIYDTDGEFINNENQITDDRVFKYIKTKTPGNAWQARYIKIYNNPDAENLLEQAEIDNLRNEINNYYWNKNPVIDLAKYSNSDTNIPRFDDDNFNNAQIYNIKNIAIGQGSDYDFNSDVLRKTAVEAKYNLLKLKKFIFNVVKLTKLDSIENMNLLYNNALDIIVLLDSRGASAWSIAQLIRNIKRQVLKSVRIIASQRHHSHDHTKRGDKCSICYQ